MVRLWRAHDTETDRIVALKLSPPAFAEYGLQVRFRREAHVAVGLIEPHVVPIHQGTSTVAAGGYATHRGP